MTNYSPIGQYPYPSLSDIPNVQSWGQSLTAALDGTTLPKFTSDSAVSTAIPSPTVGQCVMRTDIAGGTVLQWNGTRWVAQSDALIAEWTLASTGSTAATFSNIPQYWRHLRMYVSAKVVYQGSNPSFGVSSTSMTFNGDNGTDYVTLSLTNNDTSTATGAISASQTTMNPLPLLGPTSSITSTAPSGGVIEIPHYTTASRHYALSWGLAGSAPTDGYLSIRGSAWSGTTAITSISIGWGGYSVYAGAAVSLYGVA